MSWNGNDLFNSTLMGGMPSGADPHQYLTTDGNGKPRWEDQLAYDETRYATVVPTTHFTTWGSAPQSVNVENIVLPRDGSTCRITLDEQVYECEATVSAEDRATLKVTSNLTITVYVNRFFIVGTPSGDEHTIHIEEIIRDFKPIDPKYLPSGSGGGMLTVNVDASVSEDGESWLITSHSHSAQEILAAVESGMNAQAIIASEDMGYIRMWLPLAGVVIYGGAVDSNIIFANTTGAINIVYDEDNETWTLQLAL